MRHPLISVILPVRNEETTIKATLESILAQTFGDFELIIVDDASYDRTNAIIGEYASLDKRIKVIVNSFPRGVANSLNLGIENTEGKYIARIDAGDIAYPSRFQRQIEYLEQFKEVFVLGSWCDVLNQKGEKIGEWRSPSRVTSKLLYKKNAVVHPTVMMRRALFQKVGKYNPSYSKAEDYELWMRTLKKGLRIRNLEEFLLSKREGVSEQYLKAMVKDTFRVKFNYLPYFFNLPNFFYTMRSFAGLVMPRFVYRYFLKKYSRHLTGKVFYK